MQKSAQNKISTLEDEIRKLDLKILLYKAQKEKLLAKIERIQAFEEKQEAQRAEKALKVSQSETKQNCSDPLATLQQEADRLS